MTALPREMAATEAAPRARAGRPDWAREGADWPNRAASRFFTAGGLRWHVQVAGQGPVLLLLHGTGAATHSWRDVLGPLSEHFTVVAPDLPGHGFTEQPGADGMSLPGMARGVAALLERLGLRPGYAAGHSAGAAILVRMGLDGLIAPRKIISLNGALMPFGGGAHTLFAPLARMISRNPFIPFLFSLHAADQRIVERLLAGTGSKIDARGTKLYARLARSSGHAGAALTMMGNWDLASLVADLPRLGTALVLVVGENDRSIPPADAGRIRALVPTAQIVSLPGLGHLAHEEEPARIAGLVRELCQ